MQTYEFAYGSQHDLHLSVTNMTGHALNLMYHIWCYAFGEFSNNSPTFYVPDGETKEMTIYNVTMTSQLPLPNAVKLKLWDNGVWTPEGPTGDLVFDKTLHYITVV